jgi:serine/threonine-protein kinase
MAAPGIRPNPSATLNYLNLQWGIKLRYPAGWEKQEQSGPTASMVMFLSPPEGPADQFRENLNVIVERLPVPVRLEEVAANNFRMIREQMPVTDIEEPSPTRLAGLPAYQISYAGPLPLGGLAGKWLQVYAVKNSSVYTVTYTAQASRYGSFLGVMQEIIASLEIK